MNTVSKPKIRKFYQVRYEKISLSSFLRYFWDAKSYRLLSRSDEVALANRIRQGDASATEIMVLSNLRLVIHIAKQYEGFGLPISDLISEGNIGLIKAATSGYDSDKGKFSVYASIKIRSHIQRALSNKARTIRIPVHMLEKLRRLSTASATLHEQFGRSPTDEELADELDLSLKTIIKWRLAIHSMISLDAPTGNDGSLLFEQFGNTVFDKDAPMPYSKITLQEDLISLESFFPLLSERERKILSMRFGMLDDGAGHTLEEIGQSMGFTRERIRQLQEKALSKLRKWIDDKCCFNS
jgi:RNA polymerase primary sigma factor